MLIGGVLLLLLPETHKKKLPDVIDDVEKPHSDTHSLSEPVQYSPQEVVVKNGEILADSQQLIVKNGDVGDALIVKNGDVTVDGKGDRLENCNLLHNGAVTEKLENGVAAV